MKEKILTVLKKIPLFIFCVLFISIYNRICGEENSIVAVICVMTLLILPLNGIGIKASQSMFVIPFMSVLTAVGAKLANMGTVYAVITSGVIIALVTFITCNDRSFTASLPFTMGYLMMMGYDVSGALFVKRLVSLAVIGTVSGILTYVIQGKKGCITSLRDLKKIYFEDNHRYFHWSLTLVIGICLAIVCGKLLGFETKTMWICLAVLSLVQINYSTARKRRLHRIPCTILGCIAYFVLMELLIPAKFHTVFIMLMGFCSMFMSSYFIKTIYNSFSALTTATATIVTSSAISGRIVANITGALLAVIITFLCTTVLTRVYNRRILKKV